VKAIIDERMADTSSDNRVTLPFVPIIHLLDVSLPPNALALVKLALVY